MQVWAPKVNTVSEHEKVIKNLGNREYWNLYFAESDPSVREQLLYQDMPDPFKKRLLEHYEDYDSDFSDSLGYSNDFFEN